MALMEPNFYALWLGKQSAQGTPNASPTKRFIQVTGDFNFARDEGSENWSDLTKYGGRTDWVNSLVGQGEPGIEASPTEIAYLFWLFTGGETVTAITGPPAASKHTFVPSTGKGFFTTAYQRVGLTNIRRHQHNDALITRLQLEGSTANKAVRATPRFLALDPGNVGPTTDPTPVMPTDKAFLYTDGSGAFAIDGSSFPGQSQFTLVLDDAWDVVYGDNVTPFDFVQGTPTATIACTVYLDGTALAKLNTIIYGTASPTAGTKPIKTIPSFGSYAFDLKQRDGTGALNGRELKGTFPAVKWTAPDYPGPNPDGGATELAFAGELRPSGSPLFTIDVYTASADVAFTT